MVPPVELALHEGQRLGRTAVQRGGDGHPQVLLVGITDAARDGLVAKLRHPERDLERFAPYQRIRVAEIGAGRELRRAGVHRTEQDEHVALHVPMGGVEPRHHLGPDGGAEPAEPRKEFSPHAGQLCVGQRIQQRIRRGRTEAPDQWFHERGVRILGLQQVAQQRQHAMGLPHVVGEKGHGLALERRQARCVEARDLGGARRIVDFQCRHERFSLPEWHLARSVAPANGRGVRG